METVSYSRPYGEMRTDEPPENARERLHLREIQEIHKAEKVPRRNGAGRSLEGTLCLDSRPFITRLEAGHP